MSAGAPNVSRLALLLDKMATSKTGGHDSAPLTENSNLLQIFNEIGVLYTYSVIK